MNDPSPNEALRREAGFKDTQTRCVGHPFARAFVPLDRTLILGGRRRGAAAAGLSIGSSQVFSNKQRSTQQSWMFAKVAAARGRGD